MAALPGRFIWFEHTSGTPAAAQAFYGEALGWRVRSVPLGPKRYDMIHAGDAMIGGFPPAAGATGPASWLSSLAVDGVDTAASRVAAWGGNVLEVPSEIPTVGRRTKVVDPQGAVFYLFHPTEQIGAAPAPGRFAWNELETGDPKEAVAFYEAAFGYTWREEEVGSMPYFILEKDGAALGGVMKTRYTGTPARWRPYVSVPDCDAMVDRTRRLGAVLDWPPEDVPTVGRIARLSDPFGAHFALIEPDAR